jgi:hypothetical protein
MKAQEILDNQKVLFIINFSLKNLPDCFVNEIFPKIAFSPEMARQKGHIASDTLIFYVFRLF